MYIYTNKNVDMKSMEAGLKHSIEEVVGQEMSAANVGSGALDVFSTPSMIALMEKTAMVSVGAHLANGQSTVGGAVNIRHYKPTALGCKVVCKSELMEVKGSKLTFRVEVYEGDQLIGDGAHTRFVVNTDSFMKNL